MNERICRLCNERATPTRHSACCTECLSEGVQRLLALQKLELEEKVARSMELLQVAERQREHCAVAVSGGKASTVLAHLMLRAWPREKLSFWFGDTRLELPETHRYIRWMNEEWDLGIRHIRTPHSPWKVFREHGWPIGAKRRQSIPLAAAENLNLGNGCCRLLKHGPLNAAQKAAGISCVAIGIQASESMQRRISWVEYGEYFTRVKDGMTKIHPLGIWTDDDLWAYHDRYDIPRNPLYAMGYRGNGCFPCAMGIMFPQNNIWILRHAHPKHFAILVRKGMTEVINRYREYAIADNPRCKMAHRPILPERGDGARGEQLELEEEIP